MVSYPETSIVSKLPGPHPQSPRSSQLSRKICMVTKFLTGPLPTGQMNLNSYQVLAREKIYSSQTTGKKFFSGSAALLDQSLLTILAHTIQKSNYFYQTK